MVVLHWYYELVAQLVEHPALNRKVAGSNPVELRTVRDVPSLNGVDIVEPSIFSCPVGVVRPIIQPSRGWDSGSNPGRGI